MSDQNMNMQTETQNSEVNKIDLLLYIKAAWKKFKRLWWIPFLFALIAGGYRFARFDYTYSPYYTTSVTAYVNLAEEEKDTYQETLTAEQMNVLFPYLMDNGLLSDAICDKMGVDSMPGSLSLSVDSASNLMTFTATGSDPEAIHDLLLATVEVFPETLSYIVGPTTFETFKDMGVPEVPANTEPTWKDALRSAVPFAGKGFLVGLVLILLFGVIIRQVSNSRELKDLINAPVLGVIPMVKKGRSKKYNKLRMDDSHSPYQFVEAVRSLRVRFEREAGNGRIFMVTSTIPNEGKTTVAVNLALSLALKQKKVLLIDCDMRNPSVHQELNLSNEKGLHDVLKGTTDLGKAIIHMPESGLYVLPAGSAAKDSTELYNSDKMKEMLEQLRAYANYIIVDTPPSMVLSDSMALSSYTDGCVYVVRKEEARIRTIIGGVSQLTETGSKIIGTVFNGSNGETGGYSAYGKYGSYGGKYGKYGKYGSYGKRGKYGYGAYGEKAESR